MPEFNQAVVVTLPADSQQAFVVQRPDDIYPTYVVLGDGSVQAGTGSSPPGSLDTSSKLFLWRHCR